MPVKGRPLNIQRPFLLGVSGILILVLCWLNVKNLAHPCADEMIGLIYSLSRAETSSAVAARQKRIV